MKLPIFIRRFFLRELKLYKEALNKAALGKSPSISAPPELGG